MVASSLVCPPRSIPIVGKDGLPTDPWHRFFAQLAQELSSEVEVPEITVRVTNHTVSTDLFDDSREITGFTQTFEVTRAGVVLCDFKCECVHRGIVTGVIVVAGRLHYRFAATEAGLAAATRRAPLGAVSGQNIYDITDHYGNVTFTGAVEVEPGWYEFSVWMTSDTSTPHVSGECAEISNGVDNPYNAFRTVTILDGEGIDIATPQ